MKPRRSQRTASEPMRDATLIVRFTRTSPTHHRLDLVHGGTATSRELETRSTLRHDLVHFALETEARLSESFYGLLARGVAYEDLAKNDMQNGTSEIAVTERVVGALQGAWKRGVDARGFLAAFRGYEAACARRVPDWLTEELVARAMERLRALEGEWRATKFGATMELRFPTPG